MIFGKCPSFVGSNTAAATLCIGNLGKSALLAIVFCNWGNLLHRGKGIPGGSDNTLDCSLQEDIQQWRLNTKSNLDHFQEHNSAEPTSGAANALQPQFEAQ